MTKDRKIRGDGEFDGRGLSEGSKEHWFKSGDGRKRTGRPKGSKSLKTIYNAVANEKIEMRRNDRVIRMSRLEAIVTRQAEQGVSGKGTGGDRFLTRYEQYAPVEVEPDLTQKLLGEDQEILAFAFERGILGPPAEQSDHVSDPAEPQSDQASEDGEASDPTTEDGGQ